MAQPVGSGAGGHPLSYAQLEGVWINAGGPANLAPLAAAIAEAESGGRPGAVNPNDNNGTQTSWGIWQISNGTHSSVSPRWNVPLVNGRLAVAKWKAAGGFSPWGTYDSGAYKPYMQNGTAPDFNYPGGTGKGGAPLPPGVGAGLGATTSGPGPGCLASFSLPTLSAPLGLGSVGGQSVCLVQKSQARAFLGGLLIVGGGVILLGAFLLITGRSGPSPAALGAAIGASVSKGKADSAANQQAAASGGLATLGSTPARSAGSAAPAVEGAGAEAAIAA